MSVPFVHCDELIDDDAQPECLRKFLEYNRRPAIEKTLSDADAPKLFARLLLKQTGREYLGYWAKNEPAMKTIELAAGQRVRVVMASRFGDVGITPDLTASHGYIARVPVSSLDDFSDSVSRPQSTSTGE